MDLAGLARLVGASSHAQRGQRVTSSISGQGKGGNQSMFLSSSPFLSQINIEDVF